MNFSETDQAKDTCEKNESKKAAGPSLDLPCAASRRSPPDGPVLQSASPEHARSHHDLSKSPRAAFPGAHVRALRQRPYQKGGLPSLVSGRRLGPVPGRAAYNTQNLTALTGKAAVLGGGKVSTGSHIPTSCLPRTLC